MLAVNLRSPSDIGQALMRARVSCVMDLLVARRAILQTIERCKQKTVDCEQRAEHCKS